nr:MAG TPA: hypothetical protein [Caudoviricetes sp.]
MCMTDKRKELIETKDTVCALMFVLSIALWLTTWSVAGYTLTALSLVYMEVSKRWRRN